ncbi:PucR family transcriptional regulator [Amycolatopsis sacchari]|uniref:PucR family transcriptional regulator n=1 Tax=Amycolatopsis sacchari TaxID=115433 RepID=UPI003D760CDC
MEHERGDPPVHVRNLIAGKCLGTAELVGGESGLDTPVESVTVVSSADASTGLPIGALMVAMLIDDSAVQAEVLLRRAAAARAAAVVLATSRRLPLSTKKLADRLGIALFIVRESEAVGVAWRVEQVVREPPRAFLPVLARVITRLHVPAQSAAEVVEVLNTELGCTVALVGPDGSTLAGKAPPDIDVELFAMPIAHTVVVDDGFRLYSPIVVETPVRAESWLVAATPAWHRSWVSVAHQVCTVAGLAARSWVLRGRLLAEAEARDHSVLLAELLEGQQVLSQGTVERALKAGWRLDGWHTGIHLREVESSTARWRPTGEVRDRLRAQGIDGPVVERSDGWVCWVTEEREPSSQSYRDITARLARAVEELTETVRVVAGVGRPCAGASGIARSLGEAHEAALFAGAGRDASPVEHIDRLGLRRLLSGWYHSDAFRSYAYSLLQPLLGDDDGAELLATLAVYLDRESSATSTAAALGVHRNTVSYRIGRVERLLSVNLANADDRLVLQLACRVVEPDIGAHR